VLLWLLALACLLHGCAALHRPSVEQGVPERLPPPRVWTLDGRVGAKVAERGWSARLHWHQSGEEFSARLSGPFGQGAVDVEKDSRGLRLRESGREHRGAALDKWASEQFGAPLPVAELPYWLIGLPNPEGGASVRRGPQGLISRLEQAGWRVEFQTWRRFGNRLLPRRLLLVHGDLRLTLVVHAWQEG